MPGKRSTKRSKSSGTKKIKKRASAKKRPKSAPSLFHPLRLGIAQPFQQAITPSLVKVTRLTRPSSRQPSQGCLDVGSARFPQRFHRHGSILEKLDVVLTVEMRQPPRNIWIAN